MLPDARTIKGARDRAVLALLIGAGLRRSELVALDCAHIQHRDGQAVFTIVKTYAEQLGIVVRPHDLRRSFAKLAYLGQSPLEQIQFSLGHASIVTTEIYLGVKQNLQDAPCDHLGLSGFGPAFGVRTAPDEKSSLE